MSIPSRLLASLLLCTLAACSGGGSNSRLDYKEAKSLTGLDVPPDLISPQNSGDTELPQVGKGEGGVVLPRAEAVRLGRDGAERWLVVDEPVEQLWPRLRSFWATLGLELTRDEPRLGIMETVWAENRADAPGGFIADWVKTVFKNAYSSGTRDRYRLRLERAANGGSEIIVTHYGLKEVVVPSRDELDPGHMRWEARPSDRELANEVLNRLVLYLGGDEAVAEQVRREDEVSKPRARIDGDTLYIDEGFARSWRLSGIALDRLGVVVVDRDRSRGIYYVEQVELAGGQEKGWFGSLFSREEAAEQGPLKLLVVLQEEGGQTRLQVRNPDGSVRSDNVAGELLVRLQQELH